MTKPAIPPALWHYYQHAHAHSQGQTPRPFDPAQLSSSGGVTLKPGSPGATLEGTEGADLIVTTVEAWRLSGLGGDDLMLGSPQADRIDGGTGNNLMVGGLGDDVYTVNGADGEVIIERAGEGLDSVYSQVGYTLPDHVENLYGLYSVSFDNLPLVGNASDNHIVGAPRTPDTLLGLDGNDTLNGANGSAELDGGNGDDTLLLESGKATGGAGADTFVAVGVDTRLSPFPYLISIADFNPAEGDRLIFDASQAYSTPDLVASGALRFDAATHDLVLDFDPATSGTGNQIVHLAGVDTFDAAWVSVL